MSEEPTHREGPSSRKGKRDAAPVYLERGQVVGRYVILDRIGEGGMGVV